MALAAWGLILTPTGPAIAGTGVSVVTEPGVGARRVEATVEASGLLVALTARHAFPGWDAVGAASVSRGRWRFTGGTFRLRTLAGWVSGEVSRPRDLRLWRRGPAHGPSTAAIGPRGVVLDGALGFLAGTVALLRPPPGTSGRSGFLVVVGRRGPGLVWEVITGEVPLASGTLVEGAFGLVGRSGGMVLGLRRELEAQAVRVAFRRRLGRHRLDGVWEIRSGDLTGSGWLLGVPDPGWGVRYRGGAVEIRHAERPTEDGPRRRSALAVRGRTPGAAWRLELRRDVLEPGSERVRLRSAVETRGEGRWRWRLALDLEPDPRGSVHSLVSVGVRGPAVLGMIVRARLAAAQGGGFWTAERLGLRSVQPIYLRAGERLISMGIRRGMWELAATERAGGGERDVRAGVSLRLPFGRRGRR